MHVLTQDDIAEITASVAALKARGVKSEDDIQAVSTANRVCNTLDCSDAS